ncbi:MAG: hypothetical protein DCC55_04090 [Chloroflexi bacterium]|nr:MAG: hypothetical protein DCC55_04090 [Chloroflexota bacterium]
MTTASMLSQPTGSERSGLPMSAAAPGADAGQTPLVGIGAAAGGLRALAAFFHNLPGETGLAYLLVAPRALNRRTMAYTLLRQATALPLVEAANGLALQADRIYIAPPDHILTVADGVLQLAPLDKNDALHNPLDAFFTALAANKTSNTVAVLLAGRGEDGVAGLQAVKEQGGWTLVQAPDDAEQPALPRRAIAAGVADTVATAGELAELVVKRIGVLAEQSAHAEAEAEALTGILEHVLSETGHDFNPYKQSMLLRRIARRMQINGVQDLSAFRQLLRTSAEQTRLLYQDCLVSVTNFFRDPDAFDMLERECITQLFSGKGRQDVVRVWVAGCSTGEEAYSIAMLLSEQAERLPDPPRLQVFATDVDEAAIDCARRGLYSRSIAEAVTPARLQRFFVKEEEHYRVKDELRERVLFAVHNVIKDPPFSRLDLLSCRNLLIYFNRDAQEKILELFHYALQPEGYLFLGTAESAETSAHLFAIRNKRCHLYQRRTTGTALARHLRLPAITSGGGRVLPAPVRPAEPRVRGIEDLYQSWSLRRYAPPRLLIDDRYEITHLFGGVERYLREREGAVTHNILQKVLPELRLDLRAALYQALTKGERTLTRRLQVDQADGVRLVQLEVGPVDEPGFPKNQIEIVFREQEEPPSRQSQAGNDADPNRDNLVDQLEEELLRTRERLQAIIEEHQIANQELTASNEELQSINEELKSTSEELEISKEELQSMNEELVTANYELKLKIDELSRANSDLLNFMSSTEVGIIFLDRALRIKRFTPPVADLFHLIDTDLGRPLAHISHRLRYQRLTEQAAYVLETSNDEEVLVQSEEDRWYIARLLPYRTVENQVDGVVLTFVDITDLKRAEHELQQRIQQQIIAELGRTALQEPALQPLMAAAAARAAAVLEVEFCQVLALQPDGDSLLLSAGHGWRSDRINQVTISAELRTQTGYTLHVGEPVMVQDIRRENRFSFAPHVLDHGIVSGLTVLIPGEGRPYGVLGVYSREPRNFTHYDADFLESVANLLGAAVARRRAEQQIHFQARLLEAVEQAVIATDLTGKIITWNRFAESLYGWRSEEAIGRNILELIVAPEQCDAAAAILGQVSKGESWAGEFILHHRNGATFPAFVTDSPIYSETGELIGVVGISSDITERKRAERNQEFLSVLMAQVSLLSEPDEILQAASEALGRYLDAFRCHFNEIDIEADQVNVLQEWHRPEAQRITGTYSLSPVLTPEIKTSLMQGQGVAVEDVTTDPRTADFVEAYAQYSVRSYIAVPYIQAGNWVGLLVVQATEPRRWLMDEVTLVSATMDRVWPVIERARSVTALRLSEERYRALIENAGEAIFVANQEGDYIEVNPSACALLGYDPEELLSKRVTELIPPADTERLAAVREQLLNGQPHVGEWQMMHKDGALVQVEMSSKILPDGRWQAFVRDITQRKRAEYTLRFVAEASAVLARSLDYQTTLEAVARLAVPHIADWCAIDLLTDDGRIEGVALAHTDPAKIAWAHELRERYPIDPNAPAGAPQVIRTGKSEYYPDIPDELLQQVAKNEQQLELLRSVGYRSVMVVPLEARGRILGAFTFVATESRLRFTEADLAMAEDVARRAAVAIDNALLFRTVQQSEQELRASEERYQRNLAELELIYATAPVGLAVLDTDLRYLRANETLARMKGISAEAHIGKTGRELLPSLAAKLEDGLRRVLTTGEPVVDLEISVEPPAYPGQERIWLESLYPLRSPNDEVIAINAVVQDITQLKRQETELKVLNETLERRVEERTAELERSNRELDQFAYVASHDLKAPLRAISQLASWTIEDAGDQLPPAAQQHLEKLRGRIGRMSLLLDDLLAYSRAGRLHHAPERIDIAMLVRDVVETLAPPTGFGVKWPDTLPVVRTERVPLEMVLRNLIGNAIKHHHRADGQVSIQVRQEKDRLYFTVTDNGPGIEPQFHARIFELFQTLQPRDRIEGSGMGLAIVKRIVENRGGVISVESIPGQGASFHFTWPLEIMSQMPPPDS